MSSFSSINGIQFFDDLTYLSCWGQNLTSLPELPDGLLKLICFSNQLISLPELPEGLIEPSALTTNSQVYPNFLKQ